MYSAHTINQGSLLKYLPLAVAVVIGVVGVYLMQHNFALTPTASIQPETGTLSSNASSVSDSTASGSLAVKFKAATVTGYVKGFDEAGVSTGLGNNYTAAQWITIKNAGFEMFLTDPITWESECADSNCTTPNNTCTISTGQVAQIQLAYDAGVNYAIYTRNPNCLVKAIQGLSATLQAHLSYALIDIEDTPAVPVTQSMVDSVTALGQTPVIYSYQGAWQNVMSNSTTFKSYPLMDNQVANWNLSFPAPYPSGFPTIGSLSNPYGGWTKPIIAQQQANAQIPGISGSNNAVDLDSVDKAWFYNLPHHF